MKDHQKTTRRPGHLKRYARHAGIAPSSAAEQLRRVGIDYTQPFDFADADRRRAAARHADRAQFAKPIYTDGTNADEEAEIDERTKRDPAFVESQARREMFKARLIELEYLAQVGALVRKDKVEEEAFRVARRARDLILNVPARLSGLLAAETNQAKINEILTQELRQALMGLAGPHGEEGMV